MFGWRLPPIRKWNLKILLFLDTMVPYYRVVGVTGMIVPKIGRKLVKDLIIKWDPDVRLGCLVDESWVVFRVRTFHDNPTEDFEL